MSLWQYRWWAAVTLLALFFVACASSPDLPVIAEGVHGRIHRPAGDGPYPAVILLHGSGGMRPVYDDEARLLADHGYVALVLDYYAGIENRGYTVDRRLENWEEWMRRVADAADFLRTKSYVDGERIGLVGFSQGAALAIAASVKIPGIRAVVDYFGPRIDGWYVGDHIGYTPESLEDLYRSLPPIIILHGKSDFTVPVSSSRHLSEELQKRGRVVELHVYEGSGHAFNDPDAFLKSPAESSTDARSRVIEFLDRYLRNEATGHRAFLSRRRAEVAGLQM